MKYDPTLCVVLSIARVTFDKDIAAVKSLGMKYLFCLYHLVLKLLKEGTTLNIAPREHLA